MVYSCEALQRFADICVQQNRQMKHPHILLLVLKVMLILCSLAVLKYFKYINVNTKHRKHNSCHGFHQKYSLVVQLTRWKPQWRTHILNRWQEVMIYNSKEINHSEWNRVLKNGDIKGDVRDAVILFLFTQNNLLSRAFSWYSMLLISF